MTTSHLSLVHPPPMPRLRPGEDLLCQWPGCIEPIDPVAWPYHQSHDIEAELEAAERAEQDRLAHDDAVHEAEVLAHLAIKPKRPRRPRSKR